MVQQDEAVLDGGKDQVEELAAVASERWRQASENAVLVTRPAVCAKAVQEFRAERLSVALTYQDAEIAVEMVNKANLNDPPGVLLLARQDFSC